MPTMMGQQRAAPTTALDPRASSAVLDQAIARRVPIQLSAANGAHATVWRGAFCDTTDQTLVLTAVDRWVETPPPWKGAALCGTFTVANRAYVMETQLASPDPNQTTDAITIRRPQSIKSVERRRAPRRRLHPSALVRLRIAAGDASAFELCLLNMSEHGMACRVDESVIGALGTGSSVQVNFDLPGVAEPFAFDARVVSVTPTGGGQAVLGLEFLENDKLFRRQDQLRSLLAAPASPVTGDRTPNIRPGDTTS